MARRSSSLGRRRQRSTTAKLTFRRDPDFQDRRSLATLRRSQLLRDLLITSGGVAGSNSRLWRSQAGDAEGPSVFSIFSSVQSLQYLSFLPAIFRGLLQELRRSLR